MAKTNTQETQERGYTREQIQGADRMARIITSVPSGNKRDLLVTMADVFMSGMEVGAKLGNKTV